MRPGGLVKIYDSALMSSSQYKCLLTSEQTTADELLAILLQCYNSTEGVERFSLYEVSNFNRWFSLFMYQCRVSGRDASQNNFNICYSIFNRKIGTYQKLLQNLLILSRYNVSENNKLISAFINSRYVPHKSTSENSTLMTSPSWFSGHGPQRPNATSGLEGTLEHHPYPHEPSLCLRKRHRRTRNPPGPSQPSLQSQRARRNDTAQCTSSPASAIVGKPKTTICISDQRSECRGTVDSSRPSVAGDTSGQQTNDFVKCEYGSVL